MNILITGVSQGLGLETLSIALEAGHSVYGISRSKSQDLEALENKYTDHFFWKSVDLMMEENIQKVIFKSFIGTKTPIHGIVNNAAIAYDDLVTNLSSKSLENMYRINVFNPMIIVKYGIRNMLLHRISGSIVHLSSISAHTGYKGLAMYASTKGALEAFSKNVAREWGGMKIRSNCLVAGFMETAMSSTLSTEQKERIYTRTSMKQATSQNSVAKTILFLLGNDASSITGQNIFVDSGTI
jgi:3-oxoacyl-[acyl-carrier protein] reductase